MMRAIARARLVWDLAWTRILLWVATTATGREITPATRLYLADLHFRLADEYELTRRHVMARKHRKIANALAVQGPPSPNPPRAAAMAMPVPVPPIFTDARGIVADDPPDDIA